MSLRALLNKPANVVEVQGLPRDRLVPQSSADTLIKYIQGY